MSLEVSVDIPEIIQFSAKFHTNLYLKPQAVLKKKRADGHIFNALRTAHTMIKISQAGFAERR
jgi:hypothetical protein